MQEIFALIFNPFSCFDPFFIRVANHNHLGDIIRLIKKRLRGISSCEDYL